MAALQAFGEVRPSRPLIIAIATINVWNRLNVAITQMAGRVEA